MVGLKECLCVSGTNANGDGVVLEEALLVQQPIVDELAAQERLERGRARRRGRRAGGEGEAQGGVALLRRRRGGGENQIARRETDAARDELLDDHLLELQRRGTALHEDGGHGRSELLACREIHGRLDAWQCAEEAKLQADGRRWSGRASGRPRAGGVRNLRVGNAERVIVILVVVIVTGGREAGNGAGGGRDVVQRARAFDGARWDARLKVAQVEVERRQGWRDLTLWRDAPAQAECRGGRSLVEGRQGKVVHAQCGGREDASARRRDAEVLVHVLGAAVTVDILLVLRLAKHGDVVLRNVNACLGVRGEEGVERGLVQILLLRLETAAAEALFADLARQTAAWP